MSEFEVAFPAGRRFDDRQLRIEDDGRDFESFVYEAFSLLMDADTLRPGFGRGRDGAIDHVVEGAEIRTVVECKFIGRHATSAPLDRWAEVRRRLSENLPKLAAKETFERRGSPYAPWLDSRHTIDTYQFVISYPFSHLQERSYLEKQIADDFVSLSDKHPHLSHLALIHVQVRGWDDLFGELRRRFPLRYRWFGDLPRGVAPLRDKRFEARSFRRFLFQDSLPFFSREEYLAANSSQPIKREDQFVNNLSAELGDEALIVTGAGGVGKTRLGFELCDRLSKLDWLTLRLTDSATSASVIELIKAHAEPAQVVLFSDYAERADDLTAIAEQIALINDGKAHRVRLIATCRVSALSSVEDALASLDPRKITLGTRASEPVEIAFAEWVVRQILAYGDIPDAAQIAKVCNGLPILAAFAFFLHERDAIQFTKQFGNLTGIRDFRDWVKRRLDAALHGLQSGHDDRELLKHLALLSLHLPMTKNEADDLADQSSLDASLLEIMQTDRWIEEVKDQVVATHDVFADAIIGHYIFEKQEAAQMRLSELLRAATDQGFLAAALLAIDRVTTHPDFEVIDPVAIIRSLIARSSVAVVSVHERLLRSRFLSDLSKVQLLADYPALHAAVQSNRECDATVSHIAESLARRRRYEIKTNDISVEGAIEVIRPLIEASLTNPHPSNMILRRAFALLPRTYQANVLARVSTEPTASQTHYLLVAWLNAHLPVGEISLPTQTWLAANASWNLKTSFVARAWLDAGGQRDIIDHHVLAWIKALGETEGARFVYRAWLDAGGQRDIIDHHVLAWIKAFGRTEGARFVYRAWLDAGGQRDIIDHHVLVWIKTFGEFETAQFVYRAWLDAGGQRDIIDHHVLAWIKVFGETEGARFVYPSWLDAGGQRDLIDHHVLTWIKNFGEIEEAQFVYRAWLDAGGQRDIVDYHVVAWIKIFGEFETAQFVYRAWLDAGGQRDIIDHQVLAWIKAFGEFETAPFVYRAWLDAGGQRDLIDHKVVTWIEKHGTTENAKYVYDAWLAADGDFEKISSSCLAWFDAHDQTIEAGFVLKYIARQHALPASSLRAAIRWCILFAQSPDAVWRIMSLLQNYVHECEAIAIVRAFLLLIRTLSKDRLRADLQNTSETKKDEDSALLSKFVISSLARSLDVVGLDDIDREELLAAHADLLKNSKMYETACAAGEQHVYPALIHHVAELIERGMVDLQQDKGALIRFQKWTQAWPANARKDLELAISILRGTPAIDSRN